MDGSVGVVELIQRIAPNPTWNCQRRNLEKSTHPCQTGQTQPRNSRNINIGGKEKKNVNIPPDADLVKIHLEVDQQTLVNILRQGASLFL